LGEDIVQIYLKRYNKLNIDYATVFSLAPFISENIITIIGICLLIGAMAKSSQIGCKKALKN
jgi:NADH:ubiquinone oxidoreductase subunit 5 (subunit L)/multisubunit Na+/H+ antiporter MnhA subunit